MPAKSARMIEARAGESREQTLRSAAFRRQRPEKSLRVGTYRYR